MADEFCFARDRYLLVGKVSKAHGLRGEVKAAPFSDDPLSLTRYRRVVLVDANGELSPLLAVDQARLQGRTAVLKLDRVNDRTTAEAVQGMGLLVLREDLADLDEDEYYWHELYDLPVMTEDNREIGRVTSVFSNGAQDILVVRDGTREYLVPMIETIVKEQTEERVVIAPPPGLLEINSGDIEYEKGNNPDDF